eukprot:TRINITY_DN10662_c0_g1_i1.p1 TRINITY_DN10662_c0_g1~~TRINITY_DN10662_c0_g1_i1.p1  ORF type:complete len:144 (-),score=35.99 TRINITY_DN10662_c0_g1_i1:11-442(-)
MWSIESWGKLEQDFERALKEDKKQDFDENQEYKTIFLLWDNEINKNKTKMIEVKENKEKSKKRRVSDSKAPSTVTVKKPSRESPEFRVNSRMLYNWQYKYLEEKFVEDNYPDDDEMSVIAKELEITLKKVKNWYYNKRKRSGK